MTYSDDADAGSAPDQKRIVEAALSLVVKLMALARERSRSSDDMEQSDRERLSIEIGQVRALLTSDEASASPVSAIDRLFLAEPPDAGFGSPAASWREQIESPGTVKRLIETRLACLGGSPAGESGVEPDGGASPAPADDAESARARDDDAAFARVSEKLTSSHQYRALMIAIVVAVALAATGSLIIAGTTIFTVKDVRGTADSAIKNLDELVAAARKDADRQDYRSTAVQREITDSRRKFEDAVAAAESSVHTHMIEIAKLKDNAVEEVIKKIQADLGKDAKPLHERVEKAADTAANSLTQFETTSLAALNKQLVDLSAKLTEDGQREPSLRASLDTLDGLKSRIEQIKKDIDQAGDYAKAAVVAGAAAQTAADAAAAAEKHRDAVFANLQKLDQDIGAELTRFGATRNRLDGLVQQVSSLHPALCDQPPIDSEPWAAQAQLICIKQRVSTLENRFAAAPTPPAPQPPAPPQPPTPPQPPQPPVEPHMLKPQWQSIQRALAQSDFYDAKHIDGNPGNESKTRQGIRAWQHSVGEPETGQLTQAQIHRLLGRQPTR